MSTQPNPFEINTGADRLRSPAFVVSILVLAGLSAMILSRMGLALGFGLILIPFVFGYFTLLFSKPVVGLYTAVILSFLLLGLGRYIGGIQFGLAMDGILLLTYIAVIFSNFYTKTDWTPAKKDVTLLAAIWVGYSLLQAVNPEIRSMEAYFGGLRGSLYMLFIIPLTLLLMNTHRRLDIFLYIWGGFSILVSLKGIMQLMFGVDQWEAIWLESGAKITHVIFGKLRIFSFLCDAGQFGANQAYSAVVAMIISFVEKDVRKKFFYITVAVLGLYGMLISGTRGAISIPLAGFLLYFVLKKNKAVMIGGFFMLALVFVFFKFTMIGQDNQQIRRMRTAFDPNDASFQVRLENQKKLKVYLASRPFGGGLGHAGVKAQRYLPHAFLSNVATDSWYVLIWAEQGVMGLLLHLFILFYILIKSSYNIMFRIRDPIVKMKMAALTSGMAGVMVASYGNAVLGTFPTGILLFTSMAIMLNYKVYENNEVEVNPALRLKEINTNSGLIRKNQIS